MEASGVSSGAGTALRLTIMSATSIIDAIEAGGRQEKKKRDLQRIENNIRDVKRTLEEIHPQSVWDEDRHFQGIQEAIEELRTEVQIVQSMNKAQYLMRSQRCQQRLTDKWTTSTKT